MPKTTAIDTTKSEKRKAAIQALKDRGPAANENSVPELRERVALIEEILMMAHHEV